MAVFVIDKSGTALMPCSEKRARLMLERGRARIHRLMPFVIRLVDRTAQESHFQTLRLKLDPGSKTTGMALVLDQNQSIAVLNLFDLLHRGQAISEALTARRAMRRRRRNANLRHRAPRFFNRGNKEQGWLAPSLMHRVHTTMSWIKKLQRWAPISAISTELVKFDMQLMQNPEISGVAYQQGELQGYELREYLLEKWNRQCAYCDAKNVPLEVEHIDAKTNGGTDRVSNLTLACCPCNRKKNTQNIRDFLKNDPVRLQRILAKVKQPLKDAAVVNATRWTLVNSLQATGLAVETGSGAQTKWNRTKLAIPKDHALDAVCVGNVNAVQNWDKPTLSIKCTGRGSYQRTRLTAQGFPRGYLTRQKQIHGFQTGDLVKAVVPQGKKLGSHTGRVAVRASGSFNLQTSMGVVQGISHKHCALIQRNDGYGYTTKGKQSSTALLSLTALKDGVSRRNSG
ncbi:RNA-guided endonuclease IscB [Undibacterium sp. 5I1]|uniref:RNA-guided endonuclease IscB n=1 Tax=unclassified Undibacterium TaxID=2630295 RepID=UPI002AB46613|nr:MULTISPECIES: RNA-guided endonuclease IscB [unclassified Undibacterium]MDY7537880.1 RNA-guided endonuclease IscB [Undibacterium sp. 5I1]MEB0230358.1 RNA-guided endonuclease IscB [Undibacterium sp. 10I3]MEB0259749.1 RNA-guided endonuclease IscB [Undibacterium sp. 5I1]